MYADKRMYSIANWSTINDCSAAHFMGTIANEVFFGDNSKLCLFVVCHESFLAAQVATKRPVLREMSYIFNFAHETKTKWLLVVESTILVGRDGFGRFNLQVFDARRNAIDALP